MADTAVGLACCAALALSRPAPLVVTGGSSGTATTRWMLAWTGLALLPTSILQGASHYISIAIMPLPLLWVVPLSLYLASWIIAFAVPALAARRGELLLLLALCLLAASLGLPGLDTALPVAGVGQASIWLAIKREVASRAALLAEGGWAPVPPGPRDWRDARWDLLSVLRWGRVF